MAAKQKLGKMPTLEFDAVISKMGDNRVIWIPKALHRELKKFEGKKLRVIIDDEADKK